MTLLSSIRALFSRSVQSEPPAPVTAPQTLSIGYPPPPAGIPSLSTPEVLRAQHELVDRLIRAAATGDASSQTHTRVLIERYAAFVHLLPASESQYYASAGGLLRLGLDMSYYTLRSTQQAVFSIDSADVRQHAEPRWRMTVLIAAMLRGLMDTVPSVAVEHRGVVWQPVKGPLVDFLRSERVLQYLATWQPPADLAVGAGLMAYIIPHVVPDDVIAYLSEDPACVSALFNTLSGQKIDEEKNIVFKLVETMYHRVIERDTRANHVLVQRPQVGARPELDLLDAIRSLISDGTWQVNQKGGRLWLDSDGLYLIERNGLPELKDRLKSLDKLNAPADTQTLVSQLTLAKLTHSTPWWTVLPAGVSSPLPALRFASVDAILPDTSEIQLLPFSALQGRGVPLSRFKAAAPSDVDLEVPVQKEDGETYPTPSPSPTPEASSTLDAIQALLTTPAPDAPADSMPDDEYQRLFSQLNKRGGLSVKLCEITPDVLDARVIELDGDYYLPVDVLTDADIHVQQLVVGLNALDLLAIPAGTTKKLPELDGSECVGFKGSFARKLFSVDSD